MNASKAIYVVFTFLSGLTIILLLCAWPLLTLAQPTLIANGDFELGTVGFESEYVHAAGVWPPDAGDLVEKITRANDRACHQLREEADVEKEIPAAPGGHGPRAPGSPPPPPR